MNHYNELKNIIDKRLLQRFSTIQAPSELTESMLYSIQNGGKRLRPVLLLLFASLNKPLSETAFVFAEAIELIHTYSLIHDDLPAMDNDDMRRGKPSNHKVFGEAQAILAGDGLLSYAFEIMAEQCVQEPYAVKALYEIANAAGIFGMVSGQVMDVTNEEFPKYSIESVDKLKTGALLKGACIAGAILGGADYKTLEYVRVFSDELGLAFQITDDILDVVGEESIVGKPIGSDKKNDKMTYVSVYGIEKARRMAEDSIKRALQALNSISGNKDLIIDITNEIVRRDH